MRQCGLGPEMSSGIDGISPAVRQGRSIIGSLLLVFLVVCVFDPADKVVGGKTFVFTALWLATIAGALISNYDDFHVSAGLLVYVAAFIAIPLLSIISYYIF